MSTHPEIQTVAKEHQFWHKEEEFFKPMDIVYSNGPGGIPLGIILMGPIAVPYYEDGLASKLAALPLDIENPDEWQSTFDAYIVYDLVNEDHVIYSHQNLRKIDKDDVMSGYIPFDHGTGRLRGTLGLIKMANKWYGPHETTFFKTLIDTLSKEVKKE